ncbi:MAG: type II CAAX endopeptidase family protein [Gemmatimonadota bacterium]
MATGRLEAVFYRDGRLRPGWRIALFFFFFIFFSVVGQLAINVLPRNSLQWGSLAVSTAAALLAGWIVLSHVDGRPFGALGFPLHRRVARETLLGFVIGGALIGAAVLLLVISASARFSPDAGGVLDLAAFLAWSFLFFSLAAAWEEAVFRGYPFQALVEWVGAWPATFIASAIFSALHAANPNVTPLGLANIFLAGVLLSVAYLRTRSLWFATALHVGWNWTMASLLDFPVSGLDFETPVYTGVPTGPAWWTGAAFGPEAGLVGTVVLAAGTALLIRSRRLREDPEMHRLRPLVDQRLVAEAL